MELGCEMVALNFWKFPHDWYLSEYFPSCEFIFENIS